MRRRRWWLAPALLVPALALGLGPGAEIPTFQELNSLAARTSIADLAADPNGRLTAADRASYLAGEASLLARGLHLVADGCPVPLRAACPNCTIIALNQCNPFPAGVLKTDVTPVFATYTSLLKRAIHRYRVRFADVYTPFVGHELTYTWISRRDNHATAIGYTVMAEVVAEASGYPIH